MASIDQIIKDLEELRDTGGARSSGGGTYESRRKAGLLAKEALENSKEYNKNSKQRIDLEIKALRIAQGQYKLDQKEYKIIGEQIKVRERLIQQNEKMIEMTSKVVDSFAGLGRAAFEGSGSISAFTDHVRGLGFVGRRLDTNLETFRQLAQTGANFGQSIVEMRTAAGQAALPLDDFAKLVGENAENLAAMFGSTTQGAKRIAALGEATRRLGVDRLTPLGFTVDEINETLLLNLESQRRTGVFERLTDKQRTESAVNFAEELDRLAKLTGQQRDALRAEMEQQLSNERFLVSLQGQTEETRRRLQAFSGTVGNMAPQLATGFQDLIANAGVPVTESALALVQNIPEAQTIIRNLISGTISSEEALGQLKHAAAASVGRFNKATVTGQVEFLRLQGDVVNLANRIVDIDGAYQDQNASATSLVKNLTSFEQATKVLSAQFQGIETGMLQAFGPALGKMIGGIQNIFGGAGVIATSLAKMPAVSAALLIAGLSGKFLFPKAMQIAMIKYGTQWGTQHISRAIYATGMGRGMGGPMGGRGGRGAPGYFSRGGGFLQGAPGKGGRYGRFARSGLGRTVGAAGVGLNVVSAGSNLLDDDASNNWSAYGNIAGMVLGGIGGFLVGGPAGAMLGASLGGMAGEAIGGGAQSMFGEPKAIGGPLDSGKWSLTGEKGPELVKVGSNVGGSVTSNTDLAKLFNTQNLETKLDSLITGISENNKTMANMNVGVNTLVAVESRALKAVERTARKDANVSLTG